MAVRSFSRREVLPPCIGQLLDSTRGAPEAGDPAISARFGLARWPRALPASETLISGGRERQFVDQVSGAAFDVVADGAYGWGVEAGGVAEVVPGFVAFAGDDGQASPQPMVITTSAARTVSSVQGLGNSLEMSMPHSAMGGDCGGVDLVSGFRPGDGMVAGQSLKESEGHLRPAGVVGA